jgi:hypothetical protein
VDDWTPIEHETGTVPDGTTGGLGSLVRAPGLAMLAAVFLVEGYRWLGVIHLGASAVSSLVFGTAGLAVAALLVPVAAVVLTATDQARGWFVAGDIVTVVAVAVTVTTCTALVVGGPVWHYVAGSADLVLVATALGTVLHGERARRRVASTRLGRVVRSAG